MTLTRAHVKFSLDRPQMGPLACSLDPARPCACGEDGAAGVRGLELRRGLRCSRGLLVSSHSEDVEIVIAAIFQARPEDPRQAKAMQTRRPGSTREGNA